MEQYEVEEYVTERGKVPFAEWLLHLKDKTGQAKLLARIRAPRLETLAIGKRSKDCMKCGSITAPAIVFFYTLVGRKLIVLLAGSSKKDQLKVIAQAKNYLADYEERIGR